MIPRRRRGFRAAGAFPATAAYLREVDLPLGQVEAWFAAQSLTGFYPYVHVVFTILAPDEHYHVPLLLSPYGYSTYRGS